jgi:RNA polymerase sigma-70 factor (ECF subfamily)
LISAVYELIINPNSLPSQEKSPRWTRPQVDATASEKPQPPEEFTRLLAAARDGSTEALGLLLDRYRSVLLKLAAEHMTGALQAKGGASDLVQDSLLEAQRDFPGFHGQTDGEFLAWLRRILLNNVVNFTRHYGTEKRRLGQEVSFDQGKPTGERTHAFVADTPSPSDRIIAQEQIEVLLRALESLPADYRRVIELHQQGKLCWEEIGALMHRSADSVRKIWGRAILRLRDELRPATDSAEES